MEAIKEGIYYDMPDEEYFAIPAVHNSLLKTVSDKSPAHGLHYAVNGKKASRSQKIGSMLHMALLEPKRFQREVIPYLSGDGRKSRVRNSKKRAKKAYPNASHYVKQSKYDEYKFQAEQAQDNEIGRKIFMSGKSEIVMVAEDPVTGLPLKCKWDYINFDIGVGFDYKTTRNAHPNSFMWDIYKYKYYWQVALYRYIASLLDVDLKTQLILAQEKKPPYVAVWYDLHEQALRKGEEEVKDALLDFNRILRKGEFKGYVNDKTGRNIIPMDLPDKAYESFDNF